MPMLVPDASCAPTAEEDKWSEAKVAEGERRDVQDDGIRTFLIPQVAGICKIGGVQGDPDTLGLYITLS